MLTNTIIPKHNLPWLETQVAKLNKRAAKIKHGGFKLSIIREFTETVKGDLKVSIPVQMVEVELFGDSPKLDGWEFAGTIDGVNGESIFNMVPGHSLPSKSVRMAWTSSKCDHCNVDRYRKQTFILTRPAQYNGYWKDSKKPYMTSAAKWIVVGRTCLKDFMGHASAEQLVRFARFIDELQGSVRNSVGGGYVAQQFPIQDVLLRTIAQVKAKGYISSKKANELSTETRTVTSTASHVKWSFMPRFGKSDPLAEWQKAIEEQARLKGITTILGKRDVAEVQKIITWAHNQPDGDFMTNVKVLIRAGTVSFKHMGYIVGLLPTYFRATQKSMEKKLKKNSEYIGAVGDKITVTGKIVYTLGTNGQFPSTLLKILTDDGNMVNWWKAGYTTLGKGDIITIVGKIKKHEEYNGTKSTTVTRAKITNEIIAQNVSLNMVP